MNFAGYVPVRRGLIAHTVDGRLTNNEALAFVWLVMLADAATGSYTINAPTLRAFLPGLSADAAKRALASLQDKEYIYREITPRSPIVYPYWVNHYEVTTGPHKSRRVDLSQVFATGDVSKIAYVKHDGAALEGALGNPVVERVSRHTSIEAALDTAPAGALEGALDTAPEGALEGAHYNKNREKELRHENRQSRIPIGIRDVRTISTPSDVKSTLETRVANSARDRAMAHSGAMVPNGSETNTRSEIPIDVDAVLDALAKKEAA